MDKEIEAIENNDTWDLINLPKDKNLIGVKWVYKTKLNEKGQIDRFKVRLVAKGFLQQPGRNFGETFVLIAKLDTQPLGYEVEGNEDKVYRLKKALYGLKQVLRVWYSIIDSYMIKNGFCRSNMENLPCTQRFMETLKDTHWSAGKRILRDITGTRDCGIMYESTEKKDLIGYTDSDFAGSLDDRKNTSGFVFHLGSGVISWASKKHPIVTLLSAEAEYVAATSTSCQAMWLRRVFDGLEQKQ
eukprot:PITA_34724